MAESSVARKQDSVQLDKRFDLFDAQNDKDVFEKTYQFTEADLVRQLGLYPYYTTLEKNEGPTAVIDGREVVMLGSNNYLGLTIHSEVRQAAMAAVEEFGTSLTGSRLLNGTHKFHIELEKNLAEFLGKEDCLVFSTGYQANLGVLSALLNKNSVLIMDKSNHASIYDGARLSQAEVARFDHNDMVDLEKVLSQIPADKPKLIIVDGVFSMEGDLPPLPRIVELARKYKARLAVDDAHGIGINGRGGRGTADHFGVTDQVDLVVGTFSKTLASIGGFVAGERKVIDFIRHFGRSVLFSASLPPASVAAANTALAVMQREPERVERVVENGRYMRENLRKLGFEIGASETPVIPVIIGDEFLTLTIWKELLEEGVYVNAVLYPAVPKNKALLRTSYTSEHTQAHLDCALDKFAKIKKAHDI